jgi:hypothetical protein
MRFAGRRPSTFNVPSDVWSDGLAVADQANSRSEADLERGRDSRSDRSTSSQRGSDPFNVGAPGASFGRRRSIADGDNRRVLVWQQFPTPATALARTG